MVFSTAMSLYGQEIRLKNKGDIYAPYKIVSNLGPGVEDVDGNFYTTIILGNGQEWMGENLNTTRYANGDTIPNVKCNKVWAELDYGAWSYYNNDSTYEQPYGKLYNWFVIGDSRNVCPSGWHIPTDKEWTILVRYLDPIAMNNTNDAGGKMKTTGSIENEDSYWETPNKGAGNESGFSALPGGYRYNEGSFYNIGKNGYWWSSTMHDPASAWSRYIYSKFDVVSRYYYYKKGGFSIRCLKDDD